MSKGSEPRRHHLVPRWYLERFASNKGMLHVLDRQAGRSYQTTVVKVGTEVGYYDVEAPGVPRDFVESQLLAPLESRAKKAVERLVRNGPGGITVSERRNIATFVAAQMLRGKDVQSTSEQIAGTLLKAQIAGMSESSLRETFEASMGRPITQDEIDAGVLDHVRDPDAFQVKMRGAVLPVLIEHLEGFTNVLDGAFDWTLLTFNDPWVFTSDVPVVMSRAPSEDAFYSGIGLFTADRVEMPLDPHTVLRLESHIAAGTHVDEETRAGELGELNDLLGKLILSSHRWTFMHPQHDARSRIGVPPPPGDRLDGLDRVVELARLMRETHEQPAPPN